MLSKIVKKRQVTSRRRFLSKIEDFRVFLAVLRLGKELWAR